MNNFPISHWPIGGAKSIAFCPICGSPNKVSMHEGLSDLTFNVAPGSWTMVRCGSCRTGYLDPQPTPDTISLAYANYYTHQEAGANNTSALTRFRRGIAASYGNRKFGTHFLGEIAMGHLVAQFLPRLRRYLDVRYGRHLFKPSAAGRRLLDGNGEFLACATGMGWQAEGIDVDPAAVAAASNAGFVAKLADINNPALEKGAYDQITLSHVIEHVPAPRDQLKACFNLLTPGGRLWLQTPNIDSFGHEVFGAAWRGLEPPRHLVLFNRASLQKVLKDAGFVNIEFKAHPAVPLFIWEESQQILKKMPSQKDYRAFIWLKRLLPMAMIADYWTLARPDSAEFLTCVAFRPTH